LSGERGEEVPELSGERGEEVPASTVDQGPMPRALIGDERGLLGKLAALVLALTVVAALVVVDAAAIVLAQLRITDLTQDAASSAAARFAETNERRQAVRAALRTIADRDEDARMRSLRVWDDGTVSVSVEDRAGTLLVGRFGLLAGLGSVSATERRGPSTG
jgi:hypothetical protein